MGSTQNKTPQRHFSEVNMEILKFGTGERVEVCRSALESRLYGVETGFLRTRGAENEGMSVKQNFLRTRGTGRQREAKDGG